MKIARYSSSNVALMLTAHFLCVAPSSQAAVIDFEDLSLAGADAAKAEAFTSHGAQFPGGLFFDCCWQGWVYTNSALNQDLTVDPGSLLNSDPQLLAHRNTAYVPPTGTTSTYAVANFELSSVDPATGRTVAQAPILLPAGETAESIEIANTTWAANSILNGDSFSGPFGAADEFLLTIVGLQQGVDVGSVDLTLAAGNDLVDTWTRVSLTSLHGADTLRFALSSTDTSVFGGTEFLNTPTFFAIDNLVTVPIPEPSTLGLFLLAAVGWTLQRVCYRERHSC